MRERMVFISEAGATNGAFEAFNGSYSNTSNSSLEYDNADAHAEFERLVRIIIPVVFAVVAVVGFIGNLLVIVVVAANKHMRSTTNIFVWSLALADLAFITFCVPFTAVTYTTPRWPFGELWCRIVQYLKYVCCYASVYTLVAMTFDRFLAVVFPLSSRRFRIPVNAVRTVVMIWLVFLVANIPLLIYTREFHFTFYKEDRSICLIIGILDDPMDRKLKFLHGSFFAFGFAIPFSLICMLNISMIHKLLLGTIPSESINSTAIRNRKRVTRIVAVVVVVFGLCWLPMQVLFVRYAYGNIVDTFIEFIVQVSADTLAYMNSCLNPILYAFLSESFRKSFKELLLSTARYITFSETATRQTTNTI